MIPDWLNGADLSRVLAQLYQVNTSNAWASGTIYDLTDAAVSCAIEQQEQEEDVRPVNSLQINSVLTGIGDYLTLEALATRTAAHAALVAILVNRSVWPYLQVEFVSGELQWDAVFRIGGFRGLGVNRRAGNVISVDLKPINSGVGAQAGVTIVGSGGAPGTSGSGVQSTSLSSLGVSSFGGHG